MLNRACLKILFAVLGIFLAAGVATAYTLEPGKWTIINHGACGAADGLNQCDQYDDWLLPLAEKIQTDSGGSAIIHSFNPDDFTLNYLGSINDQNVHHILIFDWTETSIIIGETGFKEAQHEGVEKFKTKELGPDGYAYAAGDALFALINGYGLESKILHYIGHSRGAIVGSEFVRRMFLSGNSVHQVIYLDGEGGALDGLYDSEPYNDLRFTAWEPPSGTLCRFDNIYSEYSEASDPDINRPPLFCYLGSNYGGNIRPRCLNYSLREQYRHGGCGQEESDVVPIYEYLKQEIGFEDGFFEYGYLELPNDPGLWIPVYHGPSIDTRMAVENWDAYGEGDYDGDELYGDNDPWSDPFCDPLDHTFDSSLFNGDFSWGSKAGWKSHGGIFEATLVGVWGSTSYEVALGWNNDHLEDKLRHSWTYVPTNASHLVFNHRAFGIFQTGTDILRISMERMDTGQRVELANIVISSSFFNKPGRYELPEDWAGHTCRVEFEYLAGDEVDFTLFLDDIGFEKTGNPPPQISITSPQDGEELSQSIVEILATPWAYDPGVKHVDFYIDGDYLSRAEDEPYSAQWNTQNYQPGEHVITATVYDYFFISSSDEIIIFLPDTNIQHAHDYSISNIYYQPTNPTVGAGVAVAATLTNEGTSQEQQGQPIRFFINGNLESLTTSTNSLSPGETQQIQFIWTAEEGAFSAVIESDLFGDENPTNDSKETAILVGIEGQLLVDGSTHPSRLMSMIAGQNQSFQFQLTNPGSDAIYSSISVSGNQGSWVSIQSGVTVNPGEAVPVTCNIGVPALEEEGNYNATVAFDFGTGLIEASINIMVVEWQQGAYERLLEENNVEINGAWQSSQVIGETYYHLDNDPSTPYGTFVTYPLSLESGIGSKYDRIVSALLDVQAIEESQPSGLWGELWISGEDGSLHLGSDATHEDYDIWTWMVRGDNNLRVHLDGYFVDAADASWNIIEAKFKFRYTQSAWSKYTIISQSDLDLMEAGWNTGRLYFDVENEIQSGELHLYIDGEYVDSVSSNDHYFRLNFGDLSTSPYFNIKGNIDDETHVTLSNIHLDIDFYEGDPSLICTRSLSPQPGIANQNITVTVNLSNNGSNTAENASFNELPLPFGLDFVSGTTSSDNLDIDPGEVAQVSYVVRSNVPGNYSLPSRLVLYENQLGQQFSTTLQPVTLEVRGGATSVTLQLASTEFGLNEPVEVGCFLIRNSDGANVPNGNIIITLENPSAEVSTMALAFDSERGGYFGNYVYTNLEGAYSIALDCTAPFYDPISLTAPDAFNVTNNVIVPDLISCFVHQIGPATIEVVAKLVPGIENAQCRTVYGLSTAYGHTTSTQLAQAGSDTVTVSFVLGDLAPGNLYNLQFIASNSGGSSYSGNKTLYLNRAPVLSWANEPGYWTDGFEPPSGPAGTDFTFRIKYTDLDGHDAIDGYPRARIFNSGIEINNSPLELIREDTTSVQTGRIYSRSLNSMMMGSQYTYRFEAIDMMLAGAVGVVGEYSGPIVTMAYDVEIIPSSTVMGVPEGEVVSLEIYLNSPPEGLLSVGVQYLSGDSDILLLGQNQFDFYASNFDSARTVEFEALADADDINGQTVFQLFGVGETIVENIDLTLNEIDSEGCPLGGSGDINCDCEVNIIDVVTVTGNYGNECGDPEVCIEDCISSDVVPDCNVNIIDVVSVTGHYGESCNGPITIAGTGAPETSGNIYFELLKGASAIGDTLLLAVKADGFDPDPFAYQLSLIYDEEQMTFVRVVNGGLYSGKQNDDYISMTGSRPASVATPLFGSSKLGTTDLQRNSDGSLAVFTFVAKELGESTLSWYAPACIVVGQSGSERLASYGMDLKVSVNGGNRTDSIFKLVSANPSGRGFDFYITGQERGSIRLSIYDIRGRLVRDLLNGPAPTSGLQIFWDGKDSRGRRTESGVYFARLVGQEKQKTKRIVWLK